MIKSCQDILNLRWHNTIKNMLLSLILSKTNYFFIVSIPSLPWVLSVYITIWQHSDSCYLQRQCVCYLSLSNIQKQLHPSLLSCKMHSGQGMHTEKITPLARYFDTKNLPSSKMKSTLSLTSNYCLISVNAQRSQLPGRRHRGIYQHAEWDLACE